MRAADELLAGRASRCACPAQRCPGSPTPLALPLCPRAQVKEVSYMHSEGINAGEMKHGPLALVDDKLPIVVVSTMDSMHSKMAGVIQQVRGSRGARGHASARPQRDAVLMMWTALSRCPLVQLMARNGRLIVLANEEDDEMLDIMNGELPLRLPLVCGSSCRLAEPSPRPATAPPSAAPPFAAGKYPIIQVPRVDDALQAVVNIIPLQLLSYHLTTLRGFNVDQPRNLAKSVTVTEE